MRHEQGNLSDSPGERNVDDVTTLPCGGRTAKGYGNGKASCRSGLQVSDPGGFQVMDGSGFQNPAAEAREHLEAGRNGLALQVARGALDDDDHDIHLWIIRLQAASALMDRVEIAHTRDFLEGLPLQPAILLPLLNQALIEGNLPRATALIAATDASGFARSAAAAEARATIAIARGDYDGARAILVQAIDHYPGAAALYLLLARCQIATGNLLSARDVLERLLPRAAPLPAVEMLASVRWETGSPAGALSLLSDHPGAVAGSATAGAIAILAARDLGDLVTEMAWARKALAFHPDDRVLRNLQWDLAARIGTEAASRDIIATQRKIPEDQGVPTPADLWARSQTHPDDMTAAMACLAVTGPGDQTPPKLPRAPVGTVRIPARFIQYRDDTQPPAAFAAAMAATAIQNPGFCFVQFDASTALAYLNDHAEASAARAFAAAKDPRTRSDIMRLAALCHSGGIWLDTRYQCLTPFDDWIDRRYEMVALQEPMLSIGGPVLASAPGHPVIRAALDQLGHGSGSMTSDWVEAGAGLLSRALVQHGLTPSGALIPNLVIMAQDRTTAYIAPVIG